MGLWSVISLVGDEEAGKGEGGGEWKAEFQVRFLDGG